jgi:purine nucleoside permease
MLNFRTLLVLLCACTYSAFIQLNAEIIKPKVMILTTFEIGADRGDSPGELQYWVERENLNNKLQIPGLAHPIVYNDSGVYAMLTGTCNRSGLGLMLAGLDPRLDLSKTYFVLAGIAGIDPAAGSVGSAAWARWIIDADNANELDRGDAPKDWPYGIFAYGSSHPNQKPGPRDWSQKPMAFELDAGLVSWAYNLSKNVALTDTPELKRYRSTYVGFPNAQRDPFVFIGDTLGTARYWGGPVLTQWARDWCKLYTNGKAQFATTQCEDQNIAYALYILAKAQRVDAKRYLVLRTASDYSEPPVGGSSINSILNGEEGGAMIAFESAYRVAAPVVHAIIKDWNLYENELPYAKP